MQQDSNSSGNYNNNNYSTYSSYESNSGGFGFNSQGFKRLNGLEMIVIGVSIILIVSVGLWGFLASNTKLRDSQRKQHIAQILTALDDFYANSSLQPSDRRYPISVCSNSLNEVDFESTLRSHLTGKQKALDKHTYIEDSNFPRDPWGKYHVNFADKKIPFRCSSIFSTGSSTQSYPDNYPSCDFSPINRLRQCYLFTSSNNGDSFQAGYYSEVNRGFVVYSRFRQNPVSVNLVVL